VASRIIAIGRHPKPYTIGDICSGDFVPGYEASFWTGIGAPKDTLDHLVGAREQIRRHGEAEYPSGLGVDDQLELARLYDRQVRRLRALQDAAGIDADLVIGNIRPPRSSTSSTRRSTPLSPIPR
jgi:hypothetical protein